VIYMDIEKRYCSCADPDREPYPDERHFVEYHCAKCGKEI